MEKTTSNNKTDDFADEMIEIEYMLANMTSPTKAIQERRDTSSSDTVLCEQRRIAERKRVASLIVAMGIEAELPVEFYEKLAQSRRAKMLLKTVVNDSETASLIKQLYK